MKKCISRVVSWLLIMCMVTTMLPSMEAFAGGQTQKYKIVTYQNETINCNDLQVGNILGTNVNVVGYSGYGGGITWCQTCKCVCFSAQHFDSDDMAVSWENNKHSGHEVAWNYANSTNLGALNGYKICDSSGDCNHVCSNAEKFDGKVPTCTEDGIKPYYQCKVAKCHRYYSDAGLTKEIEDLDAWKKKPDKEQGGLLAKLGHDVQVSLEDNELKAVCSRDLSHNASLKLDVKDFAYNGRNANIGYVGDGALKWEEHTGESAPEIEYYVKGTDKKTTVSQNGAIKEGGAPKKVGSYTAKATYGDYTISDDFEINKLTVKPTVSVENFEYNTPDTPTNSADLSDDDIKYYFNTQNSNEGGTPWSTVNWSEMHSRNEDGTPKKYYVYGVVDGGEGSDTFVTEPYEFAINHAHDYSYSAVNNTITAICNNNSDGCGAVKEIVVKIIDKPIEYTGKAITCSDIFLSLDTFKKETGFTVKTESYKNKSGENVQTVKDVGEYTASIEVTDGSQSFSITDVAFSINSKLVEVPSLDVQTYYSDGTDKKYDLTGELWEVVDNKQKENGAYDVELQLKDKANTVWSDGTTDNKIYNDIFVIESRKVKIPSLTKQTYYYDGNNKNYQLTNSDYEVVKNTKVDAGTYDVTLHLKDTYAVWNDGTNEDKTLKGVFEIKPIKIPIPDADPGEYYQYSIAGMYLGQTYHPVYNINGQYYDFRDIYYEVENSIQGKAGKYEVKVTPCKNYAWPDYSTDAKKYTFTILPEEMNARLYYIQQKTTGEMFTFIPWGRYMEDKDNKENLKVSKFYKPYLYNLPAGTKESDYKVEYFICKNPNKSGSIKWDDLTFTTLEPSSQWYMYARISGNGYPTYETPITSYSVFKAAQPAVTGYSNNRIVREGWEVNPPGKDDVCDFISNAAFGLFTGDSSAFSSFFGMFTPKPEKKKEVICDTRRTWAGARLEEGVKQIYWELKYNNIHTVEMFVADRHLAFTNTSKTITDMENMLRDMEIDPGTITSYPAIGSAFENSSANIQFKIGSNPDVLSPEELLSALDEKQKKAAITHPGEVISEDNQLPEVVSGESDEAKEKFEAAIDKMIKEGTCEVITDEQSEGLHEIYFVFADAGKVDDKNNVKESIVRLKDVKPTETLTDVLKRLDTSEYADLLKEKGVVIPKEGTVSGELKFDGWYTEQIIGEYAAEEGAKLGKLGDNIPGTEELTQDVHLTKVSGDSYITSNMNLYASWVPMSTDDEILKAKQDAINKLSLCIAGDCSEEMRKMIEDAIEKINKAYTISEVDKLLKKAEEAVVANRSEQLGGAVILPDKLIVKKNLNVKDEMAEAITKAGKQDVSIDGYKVSNKKIASVSKKGKVKFKKPGTVEVYAIHKTGKKTYEIVAAVWVTNPDIKVNKKFNIIHLGEVVNLNGTVSDNGLYYGGLIMNVPYETKVTYAIASKKPLTNCEFNEETGEIKVLSDCHIPIRCTIGEGEDVRIINRVLKVKTPRIVKATDTKENVYFGKPGKIVKIKNKRKIILRVKYAPENSNIKWYVPEDGQNIISIRECKNNKRIQIEALNPGTVFLYADIDGYIIKKEIRIK